MTTVKQSHKADISNMLNTFLQNNSTISNVRGRITGHFIINILKVLDGTLDNYIIFDNAGGKTFDIKTYNDSFVSIEQFEMFATVYAKQYVYAYKINGVETIVKKLPE
jgi:hypothetical protein